FGRAATEIFAIFALHTLTEATRIMRCGWSATRSAISRAPLFEIVNQPDRQGVNERTPHKQLLSAMNLTREAALFA
ncbi:MAG: hypothetical protein O2960_26780, partial [Verrucomicrobia bacterium]|nr:hypothetical protein [Verrucomicrobiota bacterium]